MCDLFLDPLLHPIDLFCLSFYQWHTVLITAAVSLQISSFMSINTCFIYLGTPMFSEYLLRLYLLFVLFVIM